MTKSEMLNVVRELQDQISQMEAVLEDYLELSKNGLLCCPCLSDDITYLGERREICNGCGITELENRAKVLLGKGDDV